MRRIAICLSKGGVGKTTTAISLAHGLASAGKKVLLVDADTQGHCSMMLGVRPEAGLAELILEQATPEEAILEARDRLWLLAGGRGLAGVSREIARQDVGGEQTIRQALKNAGRYDFTILDTAPGWSSLTISALFCAEEVLAPVSLEVASLAGLVDFERSLEAVKKYHRQLRLQYVLPTFSDGRVKKTEEILEQLRSRYGRILCQPIRYSVRISEAVGYGQPVSEYAPRSTGAMDYQQLTRRILNASKEDAGRPV